MSAFTSFIKNHLVALLLFVGFIGYVIVAGTSGSCSVCSAITNSLGLPGPSTAGVSSAGSRIDAPSWELPDLDGKLVSNEDFSGKIVLIDFWATWCPPCREMIPGLIEIQEEYGADKLAIVGISLDSNGAVAVKPFASKRGINYTLLIGNEAITREFGGIQAIPTSFLIDQRGKIVSKHVGFVSKKQLRSEIDALLAE